MNGMLKPTDERLAPVLSEQEIMENKTKLLVLEFFCRTPHEKMRGIHTLPGAEPLGEVKKNLAVAGAIDCTASKSPPPSITVHPLTHIGALDEVRQTLMNGCAAGTDNTDIRPPRATTSRKFHTVDVTPAERKNLLDQLAAYIKKQENGKLVVRSKSYETKEYYMKMKKKMLQLLVPIREVINENLKGVRSRLTASNEAEVQGKVARKLDKSLQHDIQCFSKRECSRRKSRKQLRLHIPLPCSQHLQDALETADTYAVNRLEEISQDIMATYPNLLSVPINELLTPLKGEHAITYEVFAHAAQMVLQMQFRGFATTIWHRVGLLLSLVEETMVMGALSDELMEVMVDHSTKFFMENIMDSIQEEGGLDVLTVKNAGCSEHCVCVPREHSHDRLETLGKTLYNWLPFAVACLAVGLGLAYSLR